MLLNGVDHTLLLACPTCHADLFDTDDGLACRACGVSARLHLQTLDFLHERTHVEGALGARFDLRKDEIVAERLAHDPGAAQRALKLLSEEVMGCTLEKLPPRARRGRKRFARWFEGIQPEVGETAGLGILSKVDAAFESRPPIGGEVALEGGSGPGYHVPGFARRFRTVVVVDCSMTNLVLAQRVCAEAGATNVMFLRANVEELPLKSDTVDFVHENGVIEHVATPDRMVLEALRVRAPSGTYVCLSPNRYPITREPHFRIPLFGAVPRWVRSQLIPRTSGHLVETGTDLRSIVQLRQYFRTAQVEPTIFFLPPYLRTTVRSTPARRVAQAALAREPFRALTLALVNRILLPIAPYHFAVVTGSSEAIVDANGGRSGEPHAAEPKED